MERFHKSPFINLLATSARTNRDGGDIFFISRFFLVLRKKPQGKKMELVLAIVLYVVVVIIVFWTFHYYYRVTRWSSIVLALFLGALVLAFLTPPLAMGSRASFLTGLISFIVVFTFFLVIYYVIERALRDQIKYH